jgi:putative MATE family efflux protein
MAMFMQIFSLFVSVYFAIMVFYRRLSQTEFFCGIILYCPFARNKKGVIHLIKTMTAGKEWKHILLFTLPIMAGQFLQQLYYTIDSIVVGRFAGSTREACEAALASVGTCSPLIMLYIGIAMGMSTGCSIMIAQYFGAKRTKDMREAVSTSLLLIIALGLLLTVVSIGVSGLLLKYALKVPENYLPNAVLFFRIYSIGIVFQFTYNIASSILRSLGDSRAMLYFLLISSGINVALDFLFVPGFGWGVAGAALATVIAQAVSAVVSLVYMFKKYEILRFAKGDFKFHREKGILAMKLGIPTTLQQCVISMGHIAIQRLVNSFDLIYVGLTAAYTAGVRVESFILIPIFSFNIGLATFTGQNIGAGQLKRVSRGFYVTELMASVVCITFASIAYFNVSSLIGLFGLPSEALALGVQYLSFTSPMFIIFCLYIVTNGVLQGSGDVMFTAGNTLSSLLIRIISAYVLAYCTPIGYAAAWVSLPISWGWSLILATLRYQFGPWRKKALVSSGSEELA